MNPTAARIIPGYFVIADGAVLPTGTSPQHAAGTSFVAATNPSVEVFDRDSINVLPAKIDSKGESTFSMAPHVPALPSPPHVQARGALSPFPHFKMVGELCRQIALFNESDDKKSLVKIQQLSGLLTVFKDLHLYPNYREMVDQMKHFILFAPSSPSLCAILSQFISFLVEADSSGHLPENEMVEFVVVYLRFLRIFETSIPDEYEVYHTQKFTLTVFYKPGLKDMAYVLHQKKQYSFIDETIQSIKKYVFSKQDWIRKNQGSPIKYKGETVEKICTVDASTIAAQIQEIESWPRE